MADLRFTSRNFLLQLFKPVQHDVDLHRRRFSLDMIARTAGRQLILWRKRQQDIAGHPTKAWVAGIDINHAIHYHGACPIH
jgi:hypothetical protein